MPRALNESTTNRDHSAVRASLWEAWIGIDPTGMVVGRSGWASEREVRPKPLPR